MGGDQTSNNLVKPADAGGGTGAGSENSAPPSSSAPSSSTSGSVGGATPSHGSSARSGSEASRPSSSGSPGAAPGSIASPAASPASAPSGAAPPLAPSTGSLGDQLGSAGLLGNWNNSTSAVSKGWHDLLSPTPPAANQAALTPAQQNIQTAQNAAKTIRLVQQTIGAVMSLINMPKEMLDIGFANLTAPLAAVFPSMPAATNSAYPPASS
jgi:hypothetical protein